MRSSSGRSIVKGSPAKRFGFKEISVHFGTFDFTMVVIVGPGAHVAKYLAWKFETDSFPTFDPMAAHAMYFTAPGYVPVIWLPRKPVKPREIAALAHEILHVLRYMLVDWAGIPLTRDTDETFCHAMSYAMNETLEALHAR